MLNEIRRNILRHGAPVTVTLVGALALSFLIAWFSRQSWMGPDLMFIPSEALGRIWTFLTYPWASWGDGTGFIGLLFGCLWLWGIGAAVERDLGPQRYLVLWVVSTLLGSLGFFAGSFLVGATPTPVLFGALVPVACVSVVWGTRNPTLPVTLMFVLPIQGRWIAWISAALVFFSTNNPAIAPFAAISCLVAWAFAAEKLPFWPYSPHRRTGTTRTGKQESKRDQEEFERYIDQVRDREKDREERERLRKLFESSLDDDRKSS